MKKKVFLFLVVIVVAVRVRERVEQCVSAWAEQTVELSRKRVSVDEGVSESAKMAGDYVQSAVEAEGRRERKGTIHKNKREERKEEKRRERKRKRGIKARNERSKKGKSGYDEREREREGEREREEPGGTERVKNEGGRD